VRKPNQRPAGVRIPAFTSGGSAGAARTRPATIPAAITNAPTPTMTLERSVRRRRRPPKWAARPRLPRNVVYAKKRRPGATGGGRNGLQP
jgi:hypothetical protein